LLTFPALRNIRIWAAKRIGHGMQFRVQPTFRQADQAALNVFFPSLLFDQAGTTSAPGVALNAGTEDVAISV